MSTMADKTAIPTLSRPRLTYSIPEIFRGFPTDPTSVTFQPLTVRDELEAGKAALSSGNPDGALPVELLRHSVFAINGKQVDWGTADPQWVEATSPRCREILMKGFLKINRIGDSAEEAKGEADFFASEDAAVG